MEENLNDDELDVISTQVLDELTRRIPLWTLCAMRYLTLMDLQMKCRNDAIRQILADMGKIVGRFGKNPAPPIDDMERIQMNLDRKRMEEGWKALLVLVRTLSEKEGPPPKSQAAVRWF